MIFKSVFCDKKFFSNTGRDLFDEGYFLGQKAMVIALINNTKKDVHFTVTAVGEERIESDVVSLKVGSLIDVQNGCQIEFFDEEGS